MRRGTTPTIQFECDADLSAYQRVVLKSPNGTRWKIAVDDSGSLTTTAL